MELIKPQNILDKTRFMLRICGFPCTALAVIYCVLAAEYFMLIIRNTLWRNNVAIFKLIYYYLAQFFNE